MTLTAWKEIEARAAERKGGADVLAALIPATDPAGLRILGDDRILAAMARCIFNAGFHWGVISAKWPGFETVFLGFDPARLLTLMPDEWEAMTTDERIVRNGQKIMAVAANARFVAETAAEHGSFGAFLADWPPTEMVDLLAYLKKYGERLGGNTAQWFLRRVGYDGFVLTGDVVKALRLAGLDVAATPTSKRDLVKIQQAVNKYAEASGYGPAAVSKILSCSVGDNVPADKLLAYMNRPHGEPDIS